MSEKLWKDCCKLQVNITLHQMVETFCGQRKLNEDEKDWIQNMPKCCSLTILNMINYLKKNLGKNVTRNR